MESIAEESETRSNAHHALFVGLLLLEFALTHFTHVFGYLFIVLMAMLRVYAHHGRLWVPYYFDAILAWFLLSYAKTGPQYDGLCMLIDIYNSHIYLFLAHYGAVAWIVVTRILDAFLVWLGAALETPIPLVHPKLVDRYLWLALMLHPLMHSLATCIPFWDFPVLAMRVAIFAFIYGATGDIELAPVALVLHDKALVILAVCLGIINLGSVRQWVRRVLHRLHAAQANMSSLWRKIDVVVFRHEKNEKDNL